MKKIKWLWLCMLVTITAAAQETFPVNGVADKRNNYFAFTHASIVKDAQTIIKDATLLIKDGKILSAGTGIAVPQGAVVIDCSGKYIYPSFIDLYSGYGVARPQQQNDPNRSFGDYQNASNTKGAYSWNQSLKPETDASRLFNADNGTAKDLRSAGFGMVLTHQQDGIARGTGVLVALADEKENFTIIKERAAAFYSFDKGVSTQDYPTSLMGAIALLRQTYLDAQWYKTKPATEGTNMSLEAWNDEQNLPQIFDAGDKWNDLRAVKIANEFGVQYIIKGGGNEYQRLDDIKDSKASFILPLNFPQAIDVEDPDDARIVSFAVMKHWEMAPLQPGMFEKAGIAFSFTSSGLKNTGDFISNIRTAIKNGLSEGRALDAITKAPAMQAGIYDKAGSIDPGKIANFLITSGPLFDEKSVVFQNWVQGKKYIVNNGGWNDYRGNYTLTIKDNNTNRQYDVVIKGTPSSLSSTMQAKGDTVKTDLNISVNNNIVKLTWSAAADSSKLNSLSGMINNTAWAGNGFSSSGNTLNWNMQYVSAYKETPDTSKKDETKNTVDKTIRYPLSGYGFTVLPKQEDILIKNATVWTNENDGILQNTDVLIKNGKIAAVGKNLSAGNAKVIDGTGKHLTAGIIDEHSHIAADGGVNECSQSVTAEVRITDIINPDDIQIYRQLAGGVTSAHVLHGSCNTIGGQTQLIKLRWGRNAEDVKFQNWDGFIKFALGENVKRSNGVLYNTRFPDTRMGVEAVLMDAFQRAKDYINQPAGKRRDLELDALAEILNSKRFITCHSYVQSEINMLMHVADSMGFKVNTFTHILEGYKVADKMKARNINASTFSDWWAYKYEVVDAIPYNMALLTKVGVNVAVNSDDAEQARRLNQEAAKSIKYGGLTEEQALKLCTLNPAIMLHVADRVGSIKAGKDADLVLWTDDPLSIYAKADKTLVDGIVYYDAARDAQMRQWIQQERSRLIQKMIAAKKGGASTTPATYSFDKLNECEEDRGSSKINTQQHN